MAKKKRKTTNRRNATTRKQSALSPQMKNGLAAVAGGAVGSVVGGLLVRSGVRPQTATIGMLAAGGVGAMTMKGAGRYASFGVAAAGAGQLALTALAKQEQKAVAGKAKQLAGRPANALPSAEVIDDDDLWEAYTEAAADELVA